MQSRMMSYFLRRLVLVWMIHRPTTKHTLVRPCVPFAPIPFSVFTLISQQMRVGYKTSRCMKTVYATRQTHWAADLPRIAR